MPRKYPSLTLWQFLIRCHPAFEHDRSTDKLRGHTFGSRAILINKSLPLGQQATSASNRAAFQSLGGVATPSIRQRPKNLADRFSMKLRTPSAASSEACSRPCSFCN